MQNVLLNRKKDLANVQFSIHIERSTFKIPGMIFIYLGRYVCLEKFYHSAIFEQLLGFWARKTCNYQRENL